MKILYIGFGKKNSSIDGVYIRGLKKNGAEVLDFFFNQPGIKRFLSVMQCYWHNRDYDYIIIGYASPQAAILLGLISRKKVIYNALCSEFERKVVSRNLASRYSLKGFYYWFLDFLACHMSNLIMLETQHQIDYFIRLFRIPSKKFFLAWTGVDEERFFYQANIQKYEFFTVVFRGRLLPEAGGEYVVDAAKILENEPIKIIMLANGMLLPKIQDKIRELKPKNLELITEFLSDERLREIMHKCHVSLGQLSSHDRLKRTIPHKAYESIALRLPYLTARNPAVLELFKEGETCIACEGANAKDLAEKVLWAKNNIDRLNVIADNGYNLYKEKLTSVILAKNLLERIRDFQSSLP